MVTHDWVKQVFAGEKKWLKNHLVVHCNPPKYDEVSVIGLYDQCMHLPGMAQYFPSKYPKGHHYNREYFFSILATVQPEYCNALIRNSKDQRFVVNDEEQEAEAITLTEEWAAELKAFPQFARNKGRMIHLLKSKSKVGIATKGKKKFKAMEPKEWAAAQMEKEEMQIIIPALQNSSVPEG